MENKEFTTTDILFWLALMEIKYQDDIKYWEEKNKKSNLNIYDSCIEESTEFLEIVRLVKKDYEKRRQEENE